MTKITLNKCLSKLDSIIFSDIDNYKEEIEIRDILNYAREYIIDSIEYNKKYNKQSFMLIIEFINYLIQESYESKTNLYIIRLKQLTFLILKFSENRLQIGEYKWDFDSDCYTILRNIINNNGNDYGGVGNEEDDQDDIDNE